MIAAAIIARSLGGDDSWRLVPDEAEYYGDMVKSRSNWDNFSKSREDILRNFGILRPGSPDTANSVRRWSDTGCAGDLVFGDDFFFTACAITDWDVQSWDIEGYTKIAGVSRPDKDKDGDVCAHILQIGASGEVKVLKVTYATAIGIYKRAPNSRLSLTRLAIEYAEYGMIDDAIETIDAALKKMNLSSDAPHLEADVCESVREYIRQREYLLRRKFEQRLIEVKHLVNAVLKDSKDTFGLRLPRGIKRTYEYLGDKYLAQMRNAILSLKGLKTARLK